MNGVELAKQLGLSNMTVSLVLGGKPGPSEATRNRVLEAAKLYGHVPTVAARDMVSRRRDRDPNLIGGGRVALISPSKPNSKLKMLMSVVEHVQERNMLCMIFTGEPDCAMRRAQSQGPVVAVNLQKKIEPDCDWIRRVTFPVLEASEHNEIDSLLQALDVLLDTGLTCFRPAKNPEAKRPRVSKTPDKVT